MKKIIFAPLLAFLFIASLHAGEFRYLITPVETILAQVPPPPPDDSPAGMADMETLLQIQKDRTPAQIERATHVALHTPMQMGAVVFGPAFTKKNLPRTAEILGEITKERRRVLIISKSRWERVRPYDRGIGIQPTVYRPENTSYPSGHSASAATWYVFYSTAFPEYTKFFDDELRETMWCRVLGGAHYPTDTQAGRLIGEIIGREMLKSPLGKKAIEEIRAEVAALLKKHPDAAAHAKRQLESLNAKPNP